MYEVKNVVDESLYAIKKIILKMEDYRNQSFGVELEKVLREVRCLARIKHNNVIGYN